MDVTPVTERDRTWPAASRTLTLTLPRPPSRTVMTSAEALPVIRRLCPESTTELGQVRSSRTSREGVFPARPRLGSACRLGIGNPPFAGLGGPTRYRLLGRRGRARRLKTMRFAPVPLREDGRTSAPSYRQKGGSNLNLFPVRGGWGGRVVGAATRGRPSARHPHWQRVHPTPGNEGQAGGGAW